MFFEGKVTIYIPGTIPDVAKGDVFEDSVGSVHTASASSSDRKIPTGLCVFNIGEKGRMVKATVASAAPKLNSKPPSPFPFRLQATPTFVGVKNAFQLPVAESRTTSGV